MTVTTMFAIAQLTCPFLISVIVSRLNVENVLKPPQNPIIMNALADGEMVG